MRRLGAVAALTGLALALAGCAAPDPAPTPTETASPSVAPSAEPTAAPVEPTTVTSLPSGALLRLSATAVADGVPVRVILTVERPAAAGLAPDEVQAVTDRCPVAIAAGLDREPGSSVLGVLRAQFETRGEWPTGAAVEAIAGSRVATIADGADARTALDGEFGCGPVTLDGPRDADLVALLVGPQAGTGRAALTTQTERGLYGLRTAEASQVPIVWRDCVIQLSATAERMVREAAWVLPAEWGDGCLIGDDGPV